MSERLAVKIPFTWHKATYWASSIRIFQNARTEAQSSRQIRAWTCLRTRTRTQANKFHYLNTRKKDHGDTNDRAECLKVGSIASKICQYTLIHLNYGILILKQYSGSFLHSFNKTEIVLAMHFFKKSKAFQARKIPPRTSQAQHYYYLNINIIIWNKDQWENIHTIKKPTWKKSIWTKCKLRRYLIKLHYGCFYTGVIVDSETG